MSLIAAFLWNKSPRCSISTMIFNDENFQLLVSPKIHYLPRGFFQFRKTAKTVIKEFYTEIERLHQLHNMQVSIEFRIVFNVHEIPYLLPAPESKFVYKVFLNFFKKTKKRLTSLKIKPQLRKRLSGKTLKQFKKGLNSLYLVSRKRNTGFEYHLWAVALHATPGTYALTLKRIRAKLVHAMWNEKV